MTFVLRLLVATTAAAVCAFAAPSPSLLANNPACVVAGVSHPSGSEFLSEDGFFIIKCISDDTRIRILPVACFYRNQRIEVGQHSSTAKTEDTVAYCKKIGDSLNLKLYPNPDFEPQS